MERTSRFVGLTGGRVYTHVPVYVSRGRVLCVAEYFMSLVQWCLVRGIRYRGRLGRGGEVVLLHGVLSNFFLIFPRTLRCERYIGGGREVTGEKHCFLSRASMAFLALACCLRSYKCAK